MAEIRAARRRTASVVICAYTERRWAQLTKSIASVTEQLAPDDEILLVIDHNEALLARATAAFPAVMVIANSYRRGASGGRNTGCERARGEVVVFLDDDAWAAPGWIDGILSWYDAADVVAVGGAALPDWEGGVRPPWLPATYDWVFGCGYQGQPETAGEVRNVWACNMSVRRETLLAAGGFSDAIGGVREGVTQGCEETELCIRLGRSGRVLYDPACSVTHFVPRERQTVAYFRRRCFNEGQSKYLVAREVGLRSATDTETGYARMVVATSTQRMGHAAAHADRYAAAQSFVGLAGLVIAAVGYVVSWVSRYRHHNT